MCIAVNYNKSNSISFVVTLSECRLELTSVWSKHFVITSLIVGKIITVLLSIQKSYTVG